MIKTKTMLQVNKGERTYDLHLDPDAPIGEVYDALFEMQAFVVQKIQEAQPKKEEPVQPKEE